MKGEKEADKEKEKEVDPTALKENEQDQECGAPRVSAAADSPATSRDKRSRCHVVLITQTEGDEIQISKYGTHDRVQGVLSPMFHAAVLTEQQCSRERRGMSRLSFTLHALKRCSTLNPQVQWWVPLPCGQL